MANECCGTCKYCLTLKQNDYSEKGCEHSILPGFACIVFADEGIAYWMVGLDKYTGMCEGYTPKNKVDEHGKTDSN